MARAMSWHFLAGPGRYGGLIIGYFIFLTVVRRLSVLWIRWRQDAWWLRISRKSLGELHEIRWLGCLSEYQARAIDWLIDFAERHPTERVPEKPPAEIFR
jgi:hypothetical protein